MARVDHLMFEKLPEQDIPSPDMSVRAWMQQTGESARVIELADVSYANDFGTDLKSLGMTEAVLEARTWDAGEEYLIKNKSFQHLINHLARGIPLRLGWPVSSVEWGPQQGARVRGPSGQAIQCKRVLCTIPLSQLRKGAIRFVPPLAPERTQAIQRVHMGNAIKVWAVFSHAFWPGDLWDVVCTHRLFPEFWACTYTPEAPAPVPAPTEVCVTAFVCGERAASLTALPMARVVRLLVEQLDEVFHTAERPRPASDAFVRGCMVDWSKVPFIEGGYSSPSLGAQPGDRNLIAAPEEQVLFFAGEHTHPCMNPCLQGAMETGDRAAAQIMQSLRTSPQVSKL